MAKITPRQTRILATVERLNRGPDWPTIQDIAQQAGVLRGMVLAELFRMREDGHIEYTRSDDGRYCIADLRRVI